MLRDLNRSSGNSEGFAGSTERGVIRNRDAAKQLRDFSGMRFGKITPTDIDGFMEFDDKIFIYIESKFNGKPMPYGQKLAFRRQVNAIAESGRIAYGILCEHNTPDNEDIPFATLPVISYCYGTGNKWHTPREPIKLREMVDSILSKEGLFYV